MSSKSQKKQHNDTTDAPSISELSPLSRWRGAWLLGASFGLLAVVLCWGALGTGHIATQVAAIVALLLGAAWLSGARQARRGQAHDVWRRERGMQGANALSSIVLLIAIAVGVNALSSRHHLTFDLTANNVNTLSPQTQRILADLKSDVTLLYVFAGNSRAPSQNGADEILRAYSDASPRVRVETLDAASDPFRLRELKLQTFDGLRPILLLQRTDTSSKTPESAPRRELGTIDETNISSALLKLSTPQARTLFTLSGHGERPLWSGRNGGVFDAVARDLAAQNYRFAPLSLAAKGAKIPAQTSALLILAPQSDLGETELPKLLEFFNRGGRLVLWLEPLPQIGANWQKLMARLGLRWNAGLVFDPAQSTGNSAQNLRGALEDSTLGSATRHPILRGVNGDVIFPGATVLTLASGTNSNAPSPLSRLVQPIFASSDQAYARTFAPANSPQNAAPPSVRGPFLLACALQTSNKGRAVVVANALFATDAWAGTFGNRSFALSSINWAAGDEVLVSIPPRAQISNTLSMPPTVQKWSLWFSLLGLPLGCLLAGALVWWKRR